MMHGEKGFNSKLNIFLVIYYLLSLLLGLLFIPDAIKLIAYPVKTEPLPVLPLFGPIGTTLISQLILIIGIIIFIAGLIVARTDIIIISIFIIHVVYAIVYPEYINTLFGTGVYGVTLQMLSLTMVYLIIHNFSIRGKLKRGITYSRRNLHLEALNILIIFIGPIFLTYFFLVLNNLILSTLVEAINRLPKTIGNIIYVYFLNPYSQLFTTLMILGGIIWILRNIVEPVLLYLKVGGLVAKEMVIKEYNELKRRVEKKDLKIKVGKLPNPPSVMGDILLLTVIIIGLILFVFAYSGIENIILFVSNYIRFINESIVMFMRSPTLNIISPKYLENTPKVGGEDILAIFIRDIFIRFRGLVIWLEKLARFLFWWVWR